MNAAAPHGIIAALGNWDGAWYGSIAMHGYEFAADGKAHNVAFFPLFPMLCALLMRAGVPWPLAGVAINNLAFLGALFVLERYAFQRFGERTARVAVIAACVLPLSLFCTVAYSEGLFLLASAIALWCYQRQRYAYAGMASAAATAIRPLGIALALSLLLASIVERRGLRAALGCAIGVFGLAAFAAWCAVRFGDPLAFAHAEVGWRASGLDLAGWLGLIRGALGGRVHDWLSLALSAAGLIGVVVYRRQFGAAGVFYVLSSLLMIAYAGAPLSLDRYVYALIPVLVIVAEVFRRVPVFGYPAIAASFILLVHDAAAFARFIWVA
ncbi:MAG TPA: mannosyltransferase family protein [Candidatus Tyrphobacter sp.]